MPPENDSKPKSKHRKSTCAGCRRRKSKCDGKTPKCTTCIAYKDDCHYDKPPSIAYVRSLEEEIQELKLQLRQAKTAVWLNRTGTNDERKLLSTSPPSEIAGSQGSTYNLAHRSRSFKLESDISVDDNGSVSFHNSTSTMYEPPSAQSHLTSSRLGNSYSSHNSTIDDQQARRQLVLNASHQRQIEPFAIANGAARVNIPKETSLELLKYHWCWQHPLFLVVYRPAFTKGMTAIDLSHPGADDPPYFSESLLKVIHAHGARFLNHDVYQQHYQNGLARNSTLTTTLTPRELREKMTEEARFSLGMDILRDSSIPSIQALLQQSAREAIDGHSSQSWTFAGIAFRMALDIGLHLPSDKLQVYVPGLTIEDIEVRKRLFWSCYTWDKILSLYLGRMPGFTPAVDNVPLTFLDDFSDNDLWVPYYGETPDAEVHQYPKYPPCSGDATESRDLEEEDPSDEFRAMNQAPFVRISRDLRNWLITLPPHLRINPDQMPQLAPPAHIVSLNLLYHSTIILLHRPILLGAQDLNAPGPARSYLICLQATASIHDLILLQANTFGLANLSYLNAYAVYIAATIAVLRFEREVHPGEDPAVFAQRNGLTYLLDVLQKASNSMPSLERSNAIIRKRMKTVLDNQRARRKQAYSNGSTPPRYNLPTPTTQQLSLAQPTAFQTLSSAALAHSHYSHSDTTDSLSTPASWQAGIRSSLHSESEQHPEDFLPAFPGQQFPIGSEHNFASMEVDPQSRAALLGYNLDPHPRLSTNDIDWTFMDGYEGAQIHM
ncbi:hypothetical protein LTR84_005566 [Exophiala bonariae]|uniref:Zn(2)-C6 fungal-type domain-containing protein n=1 Tax=Exophiala bonariae TaxID=1690606 RepID=A0AAV9N2N6_9EURO|nr:hypothetical protein LTR84_005566 [Exophiala bonariae]